MTGNIMNGDRVRVTVEGVAMSVTEGGAFTLDRGVQRFANLYVPAPTDRAIVSVELLAPPEPDWQPDDVVIHEDGTTLVRHKFDGRWSSSVNDTFAPRHVSEWWAAGELTLLLRDGKPVES